MGDRCVLHLTFREVDTDVVQEVFGSVVDFIEEEASGWITAVLEEVNAGGCRERELLTSKRIPYHGMHHSGCDYGPSLFASFAGVEHEVDCDEYGHAIVRIIDLEADSVEALSHATTYRATLAQVKGAPCPTPES